MGRKLRSKYNKTIKNTSFDGQIKNTIVLILIIFSVCILACACSKKEDNEIGYYPSSTIFNKAAVSTTDEKTQSNSTKSAGKMINYDVTTTGRSDPFMPYDEYQAFDKARRDAIQEANAHNSEIARIRKLQNVSVREEDDISPYSFNLPVPPTSLAGKEAAASKITRTKVVGIMYNAQSPTAIINVDDQDYLVREGDKIIGQEYKVQKINQSWVTVNLGSNVYSAAIGEEFSKDEVFKYQNDIYDLENRFGGRKKG